MKQNSSIDNAIVFSEEITQIEKFSGLVRADFLQVGRYLEDHPFQTLNNNESGCLFHRAGQCEVYQVRPLDCRMFPFDIIEDEDGKLRWIVYADLCPVDFDYRPAYEHLKRFFDLSEEMAWAYCEADAPGMENNAYIKLERVY